MSITAALTEIDKHRGTQFDPRILDALEPLVAKLQSAHPDMDGYLGAASWSASLRIAAMRVQGALSRDTAPVVQPQGQPAQMQQRRLIKPSS